MVLSPIYVPEVSPAQTIVFFRFFLSVRKKQNKRVKSERERKKKNTQRDSKRDSRARRYAEELMLSYKAEAEADATEGGSGGSVGLEMGFSVAPAHIYEEEQEDGEERPDLDVCLTVTAGPGL